MKGTKTASAATVMRWTVERLDLDTGMARVESVPMRTEEVTRSLLASLIKTGPIEGMDDLTLWDIRKAKMKSMKLSSLTKKLGFRKKEEEKLSENMVFWVVSPEGAREELVFHATPAARKTASDLYHKVTRTEGDEK